jgi:uncharacterized damage-inducible protein DinB
MKILDFARAMAAYNEWMNEKLYRAAAALGDEERKRDVGAFFASLHGTLSHLYLGDEAWMQRLHGEPVTMRSAREIRFTRFEDLWEGRRQLDARIARWAGGLTEEFASTPYRFFSVTHQREHVLPGWAVVVHVFNHQTHHRGQATTILRQLGQDPGVTDLPWMPFFSGEPDPASR